MDIAVIGLACRVPGAASPAELWDLLLTGASCTGPVPVGRSDLAAPAVSGDSQGAAFGGFLPDVPDLDHDFFGISAAERDAMDPQQRLFLEVAWECLENAGAVAEDLAGSPTAVYVGQATHDHAMAAGARPVTSPYTNTGLSHAVTANRLSYLLDLQGPSMAVDTACSSSLVAVHLAVQALSTGQATLALAGGVNVITSAVPQAGAARLTALAADGVCRAFDAKASGYVRSEGAGAVLLKPLADARRAGDRILAIIKGSAVNQDGKTNGLTAPSGRAQSGLVTAALAAAGLSPEDIQYVEAHGTGTPLGDPIEARALGTVFGGRSEPVLVGSAKATIGHLEAAAGIVGLIKAVLMLGHRVVPGTANLTVLNPLIDTERWSLSFPGTARPWPRTGDRAAVGVSSFGFGGTNAHVVVAAADAIDRGQAPAVPVAADGGAPDLVLPISGRSESAVAELARRYRCLLDDPAARSDPAAVAAAATHRRTHMPVRASAAGADAGQLQASLAAVAAGIRPARRVTTDREQRVVFVYSGHGSQWQGMGRRLMSAEPAFAAAVQLCDDPFRRLLGWSVAERLRTGSADLEDVAIVQPLIFAFQLGLTAALAARGARPDAVLGHSVGEIAAAVTAGMLPVGEACRVVVSRNAAVAAVRGIGGMAVVDIDGTEAAAVLAALGSDVAVAAHTSPRGCLLSGSHEHLAPVLDELRAQGHDVRAVNVDYPSHCGLMSGPADVLAEDLRGLRTSPAALPFYSPVLGRALAEEETTDAQYWAANLRSEIRFQQAVASAVGHASTHFVEISPHPVLVSGLVDCLAGTAGRAVAVATGHRDDDRGHGTADIVGDLYEAGWTPARQPCPAAPVPLPTYPFERTAAAEPAQTQSPGGSHGDAGFPDQLTEVPWLPGVSACDLDPQALGGAHHIHGNALLSITALAAHLTVLAAAAGLPGAAVTDLRVDRPVPATGGRLRVSLRRTSATEAAVDMATRDGEGRWQQAARCAVTSAQGPAARLDWAAACPEETTRAGSSLPARAVHDRLAGLGLRLGVDPDLLSDLRATAGGATGTVALGADLPDEGPRRAIAMLDAALLVLGHALLHHGPDLKHAFVAVSADEIWIADEASRAVTGTAAAGLQAAAAAEDDGRDGTFAWLSVEDGSGMPLARVTGLRLQPLPPASFPEGTGAGTAGTLADELAASPSRGQRLRILRTALRSALGQVVPGLGGRTDVGSLPFVDLGLDSVTAVELRNRLEAMLGKRLSVALLWSHPCADALAEALLERYEDAGTKAWPAEVPGPPVQAGPERRQDSVRFTPAESVDADGDADGDDDADVALLLAELTSEIDDLAKDRQ